MKMIDCRENKHKGKERVKEKQGKTQGAMANIIKGKQDIRYKEREA